MFAYVLMNVCTLREYIYDRLDLLAGLGTVLNIKIRGRKSTRPLPETSYTQKSVFAAIISRSPRPVI